jgi:TolA-binding protein
METRMSGLETKLETRISGLETKIDNLSDKVENLRVDVARLQETVYGQPASRADRRQSHPSDAAANAGSSGQGTPATVEPMELRSE